MSKQAAAAKSHAPRTRGLAGWLKTGLFGTAMGLITATAPMQAGADTLGQALADAYNNSGLLEQNRAVLRAADEDAAQALAALRPILSWSSGYSRSYGTSVSSGTSVSAFSNSANVTLTLSLLLYDFGASKMAVDVAKETVLITRASLMTVEQTVLLRAVSAYMSLREANETLAVRQANVRLLSQELQAAQDRFEVGEVTRTDVSQAEAALAAANSGLTLAQGNVTQAKIEYEAAIGHPPGNLAAPSQMGTVPSTLEKAINIALVKHPSMDSARRQVTVAKLQVAQSDASLKPSLNLSTSYTYSGDLDSDDHSNTGSLSLGLSGPIYSGGALASAQRQALLNQEATTANLHVVTTDVRQDVADAFSDVQVAGAATISGREQVRAAEVAFEGVREEANLGSRTTLDVLTQEQDLLDARLDYIGAQVDEVLAHYVLLQSMGLLTATDLQLNVQVYDPAAYYNMVKNAPAGLSKQGRQLDSVLRRIGKQ